MFSNGKPTSSWTLGKCHFQQKELFFPGISGGAHQVHQRAWLASLRLTGQVACGSISANPSLVISHDRVVKLASFAVYLRWLMIGKHHPSPHMSAYSIMTTVEPQRRFIYSLIHHETQTFRYQRLKQGKVRPFLKTKQPVDPSTADFHCCSITNSPYI